MKEHENATWLNREELGSVDWLPADVEVVKKLVGEKKDKMIDEDLSH